MFNLKTRIYGKTLDESNGNHWLWPIELFDHMKKANKIPKPMASIFRRNAPMNDHQEHLWLKTVKVESSNFYSGYLAQSCHYKAAIYVWDLLQGRLGSR